MVRLFNTLRMACQRNQDTANFVFNGKKIVGVALNYMCAVKARKVAVPTVPLVFLKPTSSYIREGSPIVLPKVFNKVAYEVELGVVIGSRCKNVSKEHAMEYVGGYCLALDLTAQCNLTAARATGGPWTLGKGFDTSTPVSSFIPFDAVQDPHALPLWLKVNGELKQSGCTADLIFKVPDIISYVSKHMTLEENDLILTGTPHGSEAFKAGDVIECGLADLATMKFKVCDE
ncbi:acylpyruvase FAHD1, mitochondrial isoform X2 [Drosophila sulfurigaster albostrigata]|uniref:acylpyruvase FAHD1, mitochondrial isoform X2 n=2 Tax=Drosophila sulfurigaster albostrigata TaxID=89887 RepID=UPI002D21AD84|nr:acylpyruvase FAHD1, mitochondrial isoform X2 [Drosophila sulfurigaster albostrigata]